MGALIGALAAALWSAKASASLREDLARARAELAAGTETAARQRESFVGLSTEVLQNSQKSFLDLVRPVETALTQVDEKLRALEAAREGAYQALRQQIETMGQSNDRLRTETASLSQALRGPISRGRWGEIHLRRVAELSGMQAHCDFVEQTTLAAESGALRPDMIVRLPGGKTLVVDAKAPLRAFLEAQETTDDAARERKLDEHARLVKDHITSLSRKGYSDQFAESPDFVVMFIPGEAFFAAAVQRDPELLEYGFQRGVVPASPTNLVALLKTVHYAWQQEKVAENAEKIRDLGVELYDRLTTMTGYFRDLGGQLGKAVDTYNVAMASLQSRVVVPGRKLKEMGAGNAKELAELTPVESEPKRIDGE